MRKTLLVLVAVTITNSAHVQNKEDSGVLVTYEGHAEVVRPVPKPKTGTNGTSTGTGTLGTKDSTTVVKHEDHADVRPVLKQVDNGTNKTGTSKSGTRKRMEYIADSGYMEHNNNKPCNKGLNGLLGSCGQQKKPTEDSEVLFIPSVNQDEGEYTRRISQKKKDEVKVKNVAEKHSLADIINNRVIKVETESPQEGVLFISGKNNDHEETIKKEEEVKRTNKAPKEFKQIEAPLDCSNLNCDNNLASLCGVKRDQGKMKYRLFLNECYYRKVNCGFNHPENRYSPAPSEKCVHVGSHSRVRHIEFSGYQQAKPPKLKEAERRAENLEDTRRSFASRRALSTGMEGTLCDHECPTACTEDYAPVCAVSGLQGRMFLNHCLMDKHSCVTGTVWQIRPASDCVGQKKADVHNNREFIGWMQRLGVIDGKGKIVIP